MKKIKFLTILLITVLLFTSCTNTDKPSEQLQQVVSNIQDETQSEDNENTKNPDNKQGYKAMWISYLEFENMDFSSEQAFTAEIETMFKNCADIGLNTIIAQVRPFGDAFYKSDIFPSSHIVTGTQGADLLFDPLQIMVDEAHKNNLRIEAWVNPYRLKLNATKPETLSSDNPANIFLQNEQTKDYVFEANGGMYYNPCQPKVMQLITDGVVEIIENYDVDGIHFDDYFYPEGADNSFDMPYYLLDSSDKTFEEWRRENVNTLISKVYTAIKEINPNITFGISPQGNNDNNYNMQYSDVALWLSQTGYVDYIMPQIYWGYDFALKSGSAKYSYLNCLNDWVSLPKNENVKLYIGIASYRIGAGDGSYTESQEWQSGTNLANMVKDLYKYNADGFAIYRYHHLFNNTEYQDLAVQEQNSLKQLLG